MAKKSKLKNRIEVNKTDLPSGKERWFVDCYGAYRADGGYPYMAYKSALRAARRLSDATGWPVVRK